MNATKPTRPRLNWFSPLPPARTDIAHYTGRIAAALQERFDTTFWTPAGTPTDFSLGPVRTFEADGALTPQTRRDLLGAVNVYNIGNDARFHRDIFAMSRRIPGFLVLHDTVLHHSVFEMDRAAGGGRYIALARTWYGEAGEEKARRAVGDGGASLDSIVLDMPFTGYAVDDAIGVICHSEAAAIEIHSSSPTRAFRLPLPFETSAPATPTERDWRPPFRLALFGYLGSNRCIETILEALEGFEPRELFEFDIFGTAQDEARLRTLLARPELGGRALFHGFAPEADLNTALTRAHLAFNLRSPTMGEASGGILRAWHHQVPTMVSDSGWYASLPDDIVVKIPPDNSPDAIRATLGNLIDHSETFRRTGEKSRQWLDVHHRPATYVRGLEKVISRVQPLSAEFTTRKTFSRVLMQYVARSSSEGREGLADAAKDNKVAHCDDEARRDVQTDLELPDIVG